MGSNKFAQLSERERLLRVECWEKRIGIVEAADLCGISVPSLWKWYRKNGFKIGINEGCTRQNGITHKIGKEIIEMREAGKSIQLIADLAGYRPETVSAYLHKRGIK